MIAVNQIQETTKAYVEHRRSSQPSGDSAVANVSLTATDSAGIISIGGAVGIGGENGVGVAMGYNGITATTDAYIDSSTIDVNGTVTISSTDTALIGSATIAVGAATSSGEFAGAGTVSINVINDTTEAYISNTATAPNATSSITAGGTVEVTASDTSTIGSVALSAAGASKGTAAGLAISYNSIGNSIEAYIDDSTVKTGGDLNLTATSSPLLVAIAVGAAGTGEGFAGAGSITVNTIANDVDTHIDDSTIDAASGGVSLEAYESAIMVVIAGGLGISLGGAAFGAAIAYNYVGGSFNTADPNVLDDKPTVTSNHQVSATICKSKVTAGKNVTVEASFGPPPTLPGSNASLNYGYASITIPTDINSEMVSVTIGGAGATGFSLGGSVNLNFVRESVLASISSDNPTDGYVHASGTVTVSATDSSTLGAGAGGAGHLDLGGRCGRGGLDQRRRQHDRCVDLRRGRHRQRRLRDRRRVGQYRQCHGCRLGSGGFRGGRVDLGQPDRQRGQCRDHGWGQRHQPRSGFAIGDRYVEDRFALGARVV